MNALLSIVLWLALIMSYCCGHVAGRETEELTNNDHPAVTPMSDYEYGNLTTDYSDFPEVELYIPDKASRTGQLNLLLLLGLAVLQIWC